MLKIMKFKNICWIFIDIRTVFQFYPYWLRFYLRRIGQGHMPGYTGGVWCGTSGPKKLWDYWGRLHMVARAGGYYGAAFKGFRWVTQGYPLPPNIFNVALDTVVQHWISLAAGRAGGKNGWGREVRHRVDFSMRFMAWYHQRTRSGCRSRLTSWPGCLAEWDFRQTSRRRLGWSAAPSEQQGTNRRQRTNDGWQGRY